MGLFSKLFGTVNDNIIKTIKNDITGSSSEDPWNKTQERPANKKPDAPRSGFSWGDVMPDEENQYNFNGTYQQYFENIFRFYFSEYYIRRHTLSAVLYRPQGLVEYKRICCHTHKKCSQVLNISSKIYSIKKEKTERERFAPAADKARYF